MCILCVLQRASRRARGLLPWVVLSLVGLWALSQLLPPPFRLEMTLPRLSCLLFLAAYFSWYELLLPRLSLWRARRSARLRERCWSQAVHLHRLRKAATRRCRNCLSPYRDQNPPGGRFMCSYCGHISKRPVLDIPGPPAIIGDLMLSRGAWACGQDWQPDNDDRCLTERSYSDAAMFACRVFSGLLLCARWIGRLFPRIGSSAGDDATDADGRGSGRRGEGEGNCPESRSEKARRKAEEKRRARLEREMLEEEERKQREEVSRLIEEQRKLRDEQSESKKEEGSERARDAAKKEMEKKRQERRRDRDKGSSKSNSDGETGVDIDRKRDSDRKSENDRRGDIHKASLESSKLNAPEAAAQGAKSLAGKSRYFDRVKGSFLSSSKGFTGANFFGKASKSNAASAKLNKPSTGSTEHSNNLARNEVPSVADQSGRQASHGGDSTVATSNKPNAISSPPPTNVWKKSWHQLFTCSSAADISLDQNATLLNMNEGSMQANALHNSPKYAVGNQTQLHQPISYTSYLQMDDSSGNICNYSSAANSLYPFVGVPPNTNTMSEEAELFEDPCYVPDPISLIGPVSESLDNFTMNIGTGLTSNTKLDNSMLIRKLSASADVSKPSPIGSPLTRLRLSEQKDGHPGQAHCTIKNRDSCASSHGGSNVSATREPGIWQMWDTPLAQESLSIIGASSNRILPIGKSKSNQEDTVNSLVNDHTMEYIPDVNLSHFGILPTLNKFVDRPLTDGSHAAIMKALDKPDPWIENSVLQPLFINDADSQFPLKLRDDVSPTKAIYQDPARWEASHSFDLPSPDCWSKGNWAAADTCEYGNGPSPKAHIRGLFSTESDVQPLWTLK